MEKLREFKEVVEDFYNTYGIPKGFRVPITDRVIIELMCLVHKHKPCITFVGSTRVRLWHEVLEVLINNKGRIISDIQRLFIYGGN